MVEELVKAGSIGNVFERMRYAVNAVVQEVARDEGGKEGFEGSFPVPCERGQWQPGREVGGKVDGGVRGRGERG